MVYLTVKEHFDAAHSLNSYKGDCNRLHGHRWNVIFTFHGAVNPDTNIILDFKELKPLIKKILPDHQHLNDYYDIEDPTAEWLVQRIKQDLNEELSMSGLRISLGKVELFESPDCSAVAE